MNKNPTIPANQGLQQCSTGINKKYHSPVFETLPITDNSITDPETGAALPSEENVRQAKMWVDENQL